MRKMVLSWVCLSSLVTGIFCSAQDAAKSPPAPAKRFTVFCPWDYDMGDYADLVLQHQFICRKLGAEYGIVLGDGQANFANLADAGTLKKFNVLMLFGFARVTPDATAVSIVDASPAALDKIADRIINYVEQGGGLYIYGVHPFGSSQRTTDGLNRHLLKKLDAEVLFEELHDPDYEKKQVGGAGLSYFYTDRIASHPATAGVKALWWPTGGFYTELWTRPLLLGKEWEPLVTTSAKFTSIPWLADWGRKKGGPTQLRDKQVPVYACRTLGKGRIILNGGDSTIEFFNYGYSEFADRFFGRIYMENGLDGKKSDGLKLLVSSLRWLAEPSLAGAGQIGGYIPPPPVAEKPAQASPIVWKPAAKSGEIKYQKGVIGIIPAEAGGKGKVADYVAQAKALGLNYAVFCGEFSKIVKTDWDKLCAECRKNSAADFAAMPALITTDDQNNSFIQWAAKSWPEDKYLSQKNPKRVQDHLGYWMLQCNFPARAVFNLSRGQYPAELHSGYDTFAVRTYEHGRLTDEAFPGFLRNQMQGDRSRIIVMDIIRDPAELGQSKEFTFIAAGTPAAAADSFVQGQFSGGHISYVSSGPEIVSWGLENALRNTFGVDDVPGTERWRACLRAKSAVPLKRVTIYDAEKVFRTYAVSGTEVDLSCDGLHDMRHVLTAVVEDEKGGRATSGSSETLDGTMYQYFCSDRCNLMEGVMRMARRGKPGFYSRGPATCSLYKDGRLSARTVAPGTYLPFIDGFPAGVQFGLGVDFVMNAAADLSETRAPLHTISRPYENANGIIFDTPIIRRSPAPYGTIWGHNPYVDVVAPDKVDGRLVQYHYYRNPAVPTAMVAEFTMKAKQDGIQLKNGWNGFSVQMAGAWGPFKKYAIVRADGRAEAGPSADEKTGTNWRGTLQPGDSFFLPDLGEGFFVLAGDTIDLVLTCVPSQNSFRLWFGRFDTPKLEKGQGICQRVALVKINADPVNPVDSWLAYAGKYGLTGKAPAYSVTAKQGRILSANLPVEIEAEKNGFTGTFQKAALPQRLFVTVRGLNPRWTAGLIDQTRHSWMPLGVWNSATYLTIDPNDGDRNVYIGNLVKADNPHVLLTLLPNEEGGATALDIHNPTPKRITTKVSVLVSSFLAQKQQARVRIAPYSTQRIVLEKE